MEKICEICKRPFSFQDTLELFESETGFAYSKFCGNFCLDCALRSFDELLHSSGAEFTCTGCNRVCALSDEYRRFEEASGNSNCNYRAIRAFREQNLCWDCALKLNSSSAWQEQEQENGAKHEGMPIADAARIWLQTGKNEGYTYGYSEEELLEALDEFLLDRD